MRCWGGECAAGVANALLGWRTRRWGGECAAGVANAPLGWRTRRWGGECAAGVANALLGWRTRRWGGERAAGVANAPLGWRMRRWGGDALLGRGTRGVADALPGAANAPPERRMRCPDPAKIRRVADAPPASAAAGGAGGGGRDRHAAGSGHPTVRRVPALRRAGARSARSGRGAVLPFVTSRRPARRARRRQSVSSRNSQCASGARPASRRPQFCSTTGPDVMCCVPAWRSRKNRCRSPRRSAAVAAHL